MKKLIDWGQVTNTLKRLVIASIILLVLGIGITFFMNVITWSASYMNTVSVDEIFAFGYYLMPGFTLISVISSIVLSAIALKFTRNKKMADFAYSLPISRKQMFLSSVLAAAIMQTVILIVLSAAWIALIYGFLGNTMNAWSIIFNTVILCIISFLIIGAFSLASALAGRIFPQLVIASAIFAAPSLLQITRHLIINAKDYDEFAIVFKGTLYAPTNLYYYGMLTKMSAWALAFTFLLAIAYFALGCVLYAKRSGEKSGMFVASRQVHQLTKGIIGFAMAYIAVIYAMQSGLFYTSILARASTEVLFILIAGIGAMYTYDLKIYRGYMKKNRNIIIFPVLVLAALAISYAVDKEVEWEQNRQIDADKVEHINIIKDNSVYTKHSLANYYGTTYGVYESTMADIDDKEIIDEMVQTVNSASPELYTAQMNNYNYMLTKFTYKSGRQLYKYVPIYTVDEFLEGDGLMTRLIKTPGYYDALMQPMPLEYICYTDFQHSSLSGNEEGHEERLEIYKTLVREYQTLEDEQRQCVKTFKYSPEIRLYGIMYVAGKDKQLAYMDYYYITDFTPETASAYMQYTNDTKAIVFDNLISEIENRDMYAQYDISFNGKTIHERYVEKMDEQEDAVIELLKTYGYEEPDIDGNVVKISLGWQRNLFICVDDEMIEELERLYERQEEVVE